MTAEALVVVAKYPEAGRVKTRLAKRIGLYAACELYRAFILDIDSRLSDAGYEPIWTYTPADASFATLLPERRTMFPQDGPDLGHRLLNIFRRLSAEGYDRIVVLGSDSPHLPTAWIEDSFRRLNGPNDLVLGPARDGGYYLVGMCAPHDIFTSVAMSTARVLAQTLEQATGLGLQVHLLEESFDVDEPGDLEELRRLAACSPDGLAHTERVIDRSGLLDRNWPPLAPSPVGYYFDVSPHEVSAEATVYAELASRHTVSDFLAQHMDAVAKVADVLVRGLRRGASVPLSDISVVAARYHDLFRDVDRRIYRLRPYGPAFQGVPPVRHDGHEVRLALAARKAGARIIARILRKHNVIRALYPAPFAVDESILLIADAMVEGSRIVSIDERRRAVAERYADADPGLIAAFDLAYHRVGVMLESFFRAGLERDFLAAALELKDVSMFPSSKASQ